MPIVVNDDNQVSVIDVKGTAKTVSNKAFSPKFFNGSVLTGKGGQSRGLLNENRDPKMYKNGYHMTVDPNLQAGT